MGPPKGDVNVTENSAGTVTRADVADFCIKAILDDDFR